MALEMTYKPNESLEALIHMGMSGHYPLFHESWINEDCVLQSKNSKLTGLERARAKKLFSLLIKHKSLEHKKIFLLSFNLDDRLIFMKAFFKLVEGKILDQKPEIH